MRRRVPGLALLLLLLFLSAAASPARAQEEKEWGYSKGFYFRTSQFELKISTRSQFRYTHTFFDDTSASEDRGEFTLPRTRLRLDGFAYYPWLKYKVQYDFTGQNYTTTGTSTSRGPDLRDLYFDLVRNPWASVRFGQFKAPFGIQELTSSGDQEFVDRSIASETFAPSRQQGAMLFGASVEKLFGYEVGLFNGNGRNKTTNENDSFLYVVRVHWDPAGEYSISESSLDHPDKVNWTLGAAAMRNSTDAAGDLTQDSLEGFFGLKYKSLFVLANQYTRSAEQPGGAPDVDATGSLAQVGCFVVPRKMEVALRWSRVDPDDELDDDERTETRIGFGWFFRKHDLKFQADYGRIHDEASTTDEDTDVFRGQFQIVF